MKDTLITTKRKKTELLTFLICFVMANLLNVYAIITHKSSWTEIFTSMGYVLVFGIGLYAAWAIIRLLYCWIKRVIMKK